MKLIKASVLTSLLAVGLSGCAPVEGYHPAPIAPAATAARLESRTLADPGLEQFIEKNHGHRLARWPLETWDLDDLALAAYFFSPQMQIARARLEESQAAIITAGARPNPTLNFTPGVPSPYLLGLDLQFPVQTAGRRGYKIEQAKALSNAARLNLASTAWKVRSAVRAMLVNYLSAKAQAGLMQSEARLRGQQVERLGERFRAGEIARSELAAARLDLLGARSALEAAQGRVSENRAALAAALGVPLAALDGIKLSWTGFDEPPNVQSLSPQQIRRQAVLNRLDVRQRLAEYAAAQSALQLEIARQHPNVQIGPGYEFEESNNFFTLGLSVTLPVFNRNQGPIAEAEARRKAAAARFLTAQSQAIAQSEAALARYRAAWSEWQAARNSVRQIRGVLEPLTHRAVTVGETDWIALNQVQLQGVEAASAEVAALAKTQAALGQLEDAVERPLAPGETALPARPLSNSKTPQKEGP